MTDTRLTNKACQRCGDEKPLSAFSRNRLGALRHVCRSCCGMAISKGWQERIELLKDIVPVKKIAEENDPEWFEPNTAPNDVWVEDYCTWVDKFCTGIKRVNTGMKTGWQIMFTKRQKFYIVGEPTLWTSLGKKSEFTEWLPRKDRLIALPKNRNPPQPCG